MPRASVPAGSCQTPCLVTAQRIESHIMQGAHDTCAGLQRTPLMRKPQSYAEPWSGASRRLPYGARARFRVLQPMRITTTSCLPDMCMVAKHHSVQGHHVMSMQTGATPNNTPVPSTFVKQHQQQQEAYNLQHPHSILLQFPNALSANNWLAKAQAKEAAGDLEVTWLLSGLGFLTLLHLETRPQLHAFSHLKPFLCSIAMFTTCISPCSLVQ